MMTTAPTPTTQAFRMFDWHDGGRLCEVPVPVPGPGDVRLRVGGNGLCQSDLHALDDLCCSPPHLDVQLPMTLGHEIAGWIDALGPGVTCWAAGQACAVSIPRGAFALRNGSLPYGAMISTTFGGSKSELIELIALASTGRLPLHLNRHRLDEVPQVLRKMRRGEIVGRAVIVPNEIY